MAEAQKGFRALKSERYNHRPRELERNVDVAMLEQVGELIGAGDEASVRTVRVVWYYCLVVGEADAQERPTRQSTVCAVDRCRLTAASFGRHTEFVPPRSNFQLEHTGSRHLQCPYVT